MIIVSRYFIALASRIDCSFQGTLTSTLPTMRPSSCICSVGSYSTGSFLFLSRPAIQSTVLDQKLGISLDFLGTNTSSTQVASPLKAPDPHQYGVHQSFTEPKHIQPPISNRLFPFIFHAVKDHDKIISSHLRHRSFTREFERTRRSALSFYQPSTTTASIHFLSGSLASHQLLYAGKCGES